MDFTGKVALITGSNRNIGAEIARSLGGRGAAVVVNCRTHREEAEEVARDIQAAGGQAVVALGDAGQQEESQRLVQTAEETFGKLDILINNASAYGPQKAFPDTTWEEYQTEFEGAVGAAFHCTQAALPGMIARSYGRIVNLIAALVHLPARQHHPHITAKAALWGLSRSLARELGPYNITVNMVSPGAIRTDTTCRLWSPEARARMAARKPLQRLGETREVADVVLFFASDLARYVTGGHLPVDGGEVML